MASTLIPGCHVMSDLLTIREKGVIFALLEAQCKLVKTAVAQVLVSRETQGERAAWSCLGCGAMCLVEDESVCSHFLRLYCVKRGKLLWTQELYVPFQYTAVRTFFHTFPADGHQVGLNFANETEAEEFLLTVKAVQEKMSRTTELAAADMDQSSTSDPKDSGMKTFDHSEQQLPVDAPATTTPITSSDLDPHMKKLLMEARLTKEDLKDKDVAEAVDCIIKHFGGLKAVQRELRNKGPVSQTLPRSAGASISFALKKGPLPPVPSIGSSSTALQTPQCTATQYQSSVPGWIPPPPSTPAPSVPERIRKSASFCHVGSSVKVGGGDHVLNALREVFRQKQLLQQHTSTDAVQMETYTAMK